MGFVAKDETSICTKPKDETLPGSFVPESRQMWQKAGDGVSSFSLC